MPMGKFDCESGRYQCYSSGDGCVFMMPDSKAKACADRYGEGPDATNEEE